MRLKEKAADLADKLEVPGISTIVTVSLQSEGSSCPNQVKIGQIGEI